MPFDGVSSLRMRREALLRLAECAVGDQNSFCTCLWHDCLDDLELRRMGLPLLPAPTVPLPRRAVALLSRRRQINVGDDTWPWDPRVCEFFGFDDEQMGRAFSADGIERKRQFLRELCS